MIKFSMRTLLVAVALIALAVWGWTTIFYGGMTRAKLEALLRKELPTDCDRKQAEQWFARHGMDCWEDKHPLYGLESRHKAEQAGLNPSGISGILIGKYSAQDANTGWPGARIRRHYVYIFFDENGQRCGHFIDSFTVP